MEKVNRSDIRWLQRFSNFDRVFVKLQEGVDIISHWDVKQQSGAVFDLAKSGLIQNFEFTHELAWNVMKDFAEYQGNTEIKGSRDATREAFRMQLISDGGIWMDMIKSRNETSHTYDEEDANRIVRKIVSQYFPEFMRFRNRMKDISGETTFGLERKDIDLINNVFATHPEIEAAILYGSRAKGNYKPWSDIDITLKGGKLTDAILRILSDEMEELLLPYIMDISIYSEINNPELIDHIKRVGILFYGHDDRDKPPL
jgi:nucleotidyltransferase substrate binding protein (TIGR01987 family)